MCGRSPARSVGPIVSRIVQTAVVIPVKSFKAAKRRLAGSLPDDDRIRLARWMAEGVLAAAAPHPVFVACDDEGVAAWAEQHRAGVLWGPGLGLNGAIDHAVETLAGKGFDHVIVAHGDLPLADPLPAVVAEGRVVLVPDRRRDGTNVLARPCSVAIASQYGRGSFANHLAIAMASGAPVSVRLDPNLSIDVDTIDDCRHPAVARALTAAGFTIPARPAGTR
jgi:2-phospho-L-lactate/phosphoenolpyruvate guanylyltransferase